MNIIDKAIDWYYAKQDSKGLFRQIMADYTIKNTIKKDFYYLRYEMEDTQYGNMVCRNTAKRIKKKLNSVEVWGGRTISSYPNIITGVMASVVQLEWQGK